MRTKKKRLPLTGQLIIAMVGIVAGTVILCWFFNNTFLESYYIYNKQQELFQGFDEVNKACENDSLDSNKFDITFEKICSNGNIHMFIIDANGLLVRSSYSNMEYFQMQLDDMIYGTNRNKFQVLAQGENYVIQRQTDERLKADYLVLWGALSDGSHVYMRTALESIRESVAITNQFLLRVNGMTIIICIVLIVLLSRSISKPIRVLSDISRQMTELDFEAKYESNKYVSREIEDLGQSVNGLSEALEETISELKTLNISLQQDIAQKEQIDEMRKDFLANVSHELKTPLALIQGYAEGLKECVNEDAESRAFYCDVIMDESDKMNQMVKKLLTLNQLEFGNDRVEMARFDIVELLEGVILSAGIIAEQNQITIQFDHGAPLYVWGEEFKVEEVITNYLTNAIHHAKGEKRIRIWLETKEKKVRVHVFNTGMPIPEEELDKIWIKFYKVDKARTREYGGNGIGLSIVKAIMDSFQQECGVTNHEDGVEFWFELESNS